MKRAFKRFRVAIPALCAVNDLGARGEYLAERYLSRLGWLIVERNWRISAGELDLIAIERGRLIFVEVKTRSAKRVTNRYLFDAMTESKSRRLSQLSHIYLKHRLPKDLDVPWRIDLVGVELQETTFQLLRIVHIRGDS